MENSEDCPHEKIAAISESKNPDGMNVTSSAIQNSHSSEKSDPNGNENLVDETGNTEINQDNHIFVFSPSWPESLTSPSGNLEFSPSESDSSHGLGK